MKNEDGDGAVQSAPEERVCPVCKKKLRAFGIEGVDPSQKLSYSCENCGHVEVVTLSHNGNGKGDVE